MTIRLIAFLCAGLLGLSLTAAAEDYPKQPITVIVPFAAGGSVDAVTRSVADGMSETLGQRLVIENAGGAGGTIATARGARAAGDGYTIVAGSSGTHAVAYSLYDSLPYRADMTTPVGLVATIPSMLIVKRDLPVRNLTELVALAKARPGELSFGHPGIGSHVHLACELLKRVAGIDIKLVPYRGAGPVVADVVAGQIDGACDAAPSSAGPHGGGLLRAIAVMDTRRVPLLPDVATASEQGMPELVAPTWVAFFVPAGTPAGISTKLSTTLAGTLAKPQIRKRIEQLGASVPEANQLTIDGASKFVASEILRWRDLASVARAP